MCLPQKDHDHDGDEEPIGHLWEFRQGLLDIHKVKIKQKAIYPLSLDCGQKSSLPWVNLATLNVIALQAGDDNRGAVVVPPGAVLHGGLLPVAAPRRPHAGLGPKGFHTLRDCLNIKF